jgi:hypothetical protein
MCPSFSSWTTIKYNITGIDICIMEIGADPMRSKPCVLSCRIDLETRQRFINKCKSRDKRSQQIIEGLILEYIGEG